MQDNSYLLHRLHPLYSLPMKKEVKEVLTLVRNQQCKLILLDPLTRPSIKYPHKLESWSCLWSIKSCWHGTSAQPRQNQHYGRKIGNRRQSNQRIKCGTWTPRSSWIVASIGRRRWRKVQALYKEKEPTMLKEIKNRYRVDGPYDFLSEEENWTPSSYTWKNCMQM